MAETTGPLAGLKVVELGPDRRPFCTRILAEFGAEVIKVESPDGGDPLRKWRKLYEGTSLVVVRAGPQQEIGHRQSEASGRPRIRPPADRRGRHPGRELPPRRAGKSSAWAGMP